LSRTEAHGLLLSVVNGTATRLGLWLALLGALSSSCANTGGQTGDEGEASCWGKVTPLAPGAPSPLGFTAQDSLALAVGVHTALLHWIRARDFPYGPESGDGRVQVTITSLGNARFATQGGGAFTTELDYCAPSVLSDVSVELASEGGALHENFQGVLAASSKDSATLSATLLGTQLGGSFAFDPAALGQRHLAQIVLNFGFRASSFSGEVSAGLEQIQGGGSNSTVSLVNVSLACWGSAAVPGQAGCIE
jgi:hypothetical protein